MKGITNTVMESPLTDDKKVGTMHMSLYQHTETAVTVSAR
jgi:hypothetical protein